MHSNDSDAVRVMGSTETPRSMGQAVAESYSTQTGLSSKDRNARCDRQHKNGRVQLLGLAVVQQHSTHLGLISKNSDAGNRRLCGEVAQPHSTHPAMLCNSAMLDVIGSMAATQVVDGAVARQVSTGPTSKEGYA